MIPSGKTNLSYSTLLIKRVLVMRVLITRKSFCTCDILLMIEKFENDIGNFIPILCDTMEVKSRRDNRED